MYDFVIIGGGIAGVSCIQRLSNLVSDQEKILLLSSSPLIKAATNIKNVTKLLTDFDVEEKSIDSFQKNFKNITILHKLVSDLDTENHKVFCDDGTSFEYKRLCICSGGTPKIISDNANVIGIRDTQTVISFQERLKNARQVVIVGNGGIATELVYEIENCKIIWAVKHEHISNVYFDSSAAKFFLNKLNRRKDEEPLPAKRTKYTISRIETNADKGTLGSALGPDWSIGLQMKGSDKSISHQIEIENKCEVNAIFNRDEYLKKIDSKEIEAIEDKEEWPAYVQLTNGKIYGCDFIVSATGVTPNVQVFTKNNKFELASDGGIKVDDQMRTNIKDVYAAGDVCTASWKTSSQWFQMRLWSQARQMGDYAARSMYASLHGEPIELDFCFELFAHITKFFNYKVILLGCFNAQNMGNDYELMFRTTQDVEFIKLVLQNGRVCGAVLIGETDLEETFENLILNQLDVSSLGEGLLDPNVEIEDYFD